ncbi:hypothetical protein [Kitasatospora terrestris]|uniref:Uncharacterized protein n=1 Tax=Kitasatospora terrestris TaxID=258051 RepID=A0ABP9DCR1_9ACTN
MEYGLEEDEEQRLRRFRALGEETAERLETAFRLAGLCPPPGLSPQYGVRAMADGAHIALGGAGAHWSAQLANVLIEYAVLKGYVVTGGDVRSVITVEQLAALGLVPAVIPAVPDVQAVRPKLTLYRESAGSSSGAA